MAVSIELLAAAEPDRAVRVVAQAEPIARKSKDADLTGRVSQRKKELRELVSQYGKALETAKVKLSKTPGDASASGTMGRFFCLGAGDWERGLPLLAKGNDQALRKLAADDLAAAEQQAAEMAGMGDAWWDYSEKQKGIAKACARGRAAHWYEEALDDLEGLARTRVEKRLATISPEDIAGGSSGASADKGLRLLKKVLEVLPANARPKTGQPWDSSAVSRWLNRKVRSTPFDAVLRVRSVNAMRSNGRDAISAFFEPVGPVNLDEVDYRMTVNLYEQGGVSPDVIRKFKRGAYVRVRGVVDSLNANGFGGNGVDIKTVDFFLTLDRANLTLID